MSVQTANADDGYRPAVLDQNLRLATRIIKGIADPNERVIEDHGQLTQLIEQLRAMGCVIIFVTGVWDLFHIGHAEYLYKSKLAAAEHYPDADHAILIVGVDSDELTKRRKGPKRPIVPQEERCSILTHLRAADIITVQNEPNQLFRLIKHDIRIISTSTTDLPADHAEICRHCEHLVNLPPQAETSTSARVRLLAVDGGLMAVAKIRERMSRLVEFLEVELKGVTDELSS